VACRIVPVGHCIDEIDVPVGVDGTAKAILRDDIWCARPGNGDTISSKVVRNGFAISDKSHLELMLLIVGRRHYGIR